MHTQDGNYYVKHAVTEEFIYEINFKNCALQHISEISRENFQYKSCYNVMTVSYFHWFR